ncbi:UNVERIFIED_CONTAM: putative mitochondrial protein [Sesamum latifolium]|uniref:Mitochondrial protein n=1 Tax=Sesamum latifolium TaxID=2727402 RepID=A0AAW2U2Q2_9LAMI
MHEVISAIQPRVTVDMNRSLAEPYTAAEVKQVSFNMYPLKSPGPTMNHTHIVLIPKCSNPETVTQLRPISLCSVIVMIASKCIANRLKPLLDSIISHTQSAFIPGRLITDNVLLAFELNHHLKLSSRSKEACKALKLDMSKAYDRVEWPFLRGVLLRLDFQHHFVDLIMLMVSTVSYSLTLNRTPFGFFRPERGIRQGDPLSPYLFLFCAEALSCLIQQAEREGRLVGVKVTEQAPSVSHLLFTDDTLVFYQAKEEQAVEVRRILEVYARASGQCVNYHKSCMTISGHVAERTQHQLMNILGIRRVAQLDRTWDYRR